MTQRKTVGLPKGKDLSVKSMPIIRLKNEGKCLKYLSRRSAENATPDDFKRIVRGYGVENFTIAEAPTRNRVDIKISDTKTDAEKKLIEKRVKADFPLHLNVIISYVNA